MAAKKMPAKKMPAKKAAAKVVGNEGEKMTPAQIRAAIYKMQKINDKSLVSSRRSSDPGKIGPVSRKEYQDAMDGVTSESWLGTGPKVAKVSKQIAGEQWDRTFGAKKSAPAKKPAAAKVMPAAVKKPKKK